MYYKYRKPLRMRGYDYSAPGAFFVTVCTKDRKPLFSQIVGAIHESPLPEKRHLLDIVMGYLKMNVSKRIHLMSDEKEIWQRSFYDHRIRDHADYERISKYIDENVSKWEEDRFYIE